MLRPGIVGMRRSMVIRLPCMTMSTPPPHLFHPILAHLTAVRTSNDSLGELSGNRFAVVIRGAHVPSTRVETSLREACSSGFVNFFGTQRVGAPSVSARGQPLPYQAREGFGGVEAPCRSWFVS